MRWPIPGVSSIFQSPVWSTTPAGVRIASAQASGIEWAMAIYSTSKGARSIFAPGLMWVMPMSGAPGSDKRLASTKPAAKGVANTLHFSLGQTAASAPM